MRLGKSECNRLAESIDRLLGFDFMFAMWFQFVVYRR